MKPMNFRKLNIINPLIRASTEAGFGSPTEIQSRIIPKIILKKDIFGCIENEGEKTASFVIPIIQQLKKNTVEYRNIRVLIITANTESAENIDESFNTFSKYLPISKVSILNDEPHGSQIYKMRKGKDILIATPERLLELVQQGHADFSKLETVIIKDISKLENVDALEQTSKIMERLPLKVQKLLFTKNLSRKVKEFAGRFLCNATEVRIPEEFSIRNKSKISVLSNNLDIHFDNIINPKESRSFAY